MELLRRSRSCCSHGSDVLEPIDAPAAATLVIEDVVDEEHEAVRPDVTTGNSFTSSMDAWSRELGALRRRAWSGCNRALLGRRAPPDVGEGDDVGTGGGWTTTAHWLPPGDGLTCNTQETFDQTQHTHFKQLTTAQRCAVGRDTYLGLAVQFY